VYLGDVARGETLLRESLDAFERLGLRQVGGTLRDLAAARALEDDAAGARSLFERALDSFRANADEGNVVVTAGALAEAEFRCNDVTTALSVAEEGLATARTLGRDAMVAWLLGNIAAFLISVDRFASAREYAREELGLGRKLQAEVEIDFALQHLAAVAGLRPDSGTPSDRERAAQLCGFVDERLRLRGIVREYTELQEYDRLRTALEQSLGSGPLVALTTAGARWPEDRAISEAMMI
jgi:tetratricopeptide (TPR) repeat protein